ncbi:S-ribosylhomocysteine lyase [Candidatus Saccharibacteria bacterium]|nr:S-ribosylhomocysteine lyase [Candidatus Saccharibacteria bacterium]
MSNSKPKKIASFKIDHIHLRPGLYVSRIDKEGDVTVTTFDLRLVKPNSHIIDPPLSTAAMHTIEHLGATYLRNRKGWRSKIIYFGPMGCRTGFYAILFGKYTTQDVKNLFSCMAKYIINWKGDIPGTTAIECGNYPDHDLSAAKKAMAKWLRIMTASQLDYDPFTYPK